MTMLDGVDGIPDEYLRATSTEELTPEQRTEWEAEVTDNRTFDGRIPLVEYRPRVP